VKKTDQYRETLRGLNEWEPFLLENSGLPGPRGNLELAQAVADEASPALLRRLAAYGPDRAPTGTAEEFLPVCGVVGMGRLLAEGDHAALRVIRRAASDPRWRLREAAAMALQRLGDRDMQALFRAAEPWVEGNLLERRAVAAALCEPRLLRDERDAARVLAILDRITASLGKVAERKSEEFRVLRQGLGYCWSVAVAAAPDDGKRVMARWFRSEDPDVLWIMRENLGKDRLARLDPAWVARAKATLARGMIGPRSKSQAGLDAGTERQKRARGPRKT
jgi:hypothetical protein